MIFERGETKSIPRGRDPTRVCRLKSVDIHRARGLALSGGWATESPASSSFLTADPSGSRLKRREPNGGVNVRTHHGMSTNFRVHLMHLSAGQKGSGEKGGKIIETRLGRIGRRSRRRFRVKRNES